METVPKICNPARVYRDTVCVSTNNMSRNHCLCSCTSYRGWPRRVKLCADPSFQQVVRSGLVTDLSLNHKDFRLALQDSYLTKSDFIFSSNCDKLISAQSLFLFTTDVKYTACPADGSIGEETNKSHLNKQKKQHASILNPFVKRSVPFLTQWIF